MAKQRVNLEASLNEFRVAFNTLSDHLGWKGQLQTTEDSDFVGSINEILGRVDSINDTQISSAKLYMSDAAALNTIKGNLSVHDSSEFKNNLSVDGNLKVAGDMLVKGVSRLTGGSQGSVIVGDSAGDDDFYFIGKFRSDLTPDSDNVHDLGETNRRWYNVFAQKSTVSKSKADSADFDYADIARLYTQDSGYIYTLRGNNVTYDSAQINGQLTTTGAIRSTTYAFKINGENDSATEFHLGETLNISGGRGIDTFVRNGEIVIKGEIASSANEGIAAFNSNTFAFDSTTVDVKSDGISNTQIENEYITMADSAGTTKNINLGNTFKFEGRGGHVRTKWHGTDSTMEFRLDSNVNIYNSLTVGSGGISTSGNLSVTGNLNVIGDQTLTTAFMKLLSGTTGAPVLDGGISIDRGTGDSAVLFWDETLDAWYAGLSTNARLVARDSDNVAFDSGEFAGSVHVKHTVNADKVHVRDDLTVADSAKIGGKLHVDGNLVVTDNITSTSDLFIGDSAKIVGNLNVGTTTKTSDLYVKDSARVDGKLNVTTQINTAGDLFVGDSAKIIGDASVGGNMVVAGNFTVEGTTTTVNTTNMEITDNQIVLNNGQTGTPPVTLRSGIEVERGDLTNAQLEWNDDGDYWQAGLAGSESRIITNDFVAATAPLSYDSSNGTITHDTLARSNTEVHIGGIQPGFQAPFVVIDSIGTDAFGHITTVNISTINMPTEGNAELTLAAQNGVRIAGSTNTFKADAPKGDSATVTFALDSVSQTNTTDTPTLTFGGTFDAVSSVTHNDFGQKTAKTTSTYSMPSLPSNTNSQAGIVASGSGQNSKVWKTDASGNPAWREDLGANLNLAAEPQIDDSDNTDIALTLRSIDVLGNTTAVQSRVQFVGGTNIQITRTNDNLVTINAVNGAGQPDESLIIYNSSGTIVKRIYGYSTT